MKILFIGDIVGRSGRECVFRHIDDIKAKYDIDFTIANGENSSGGLGMSHRSYEELRCAGIDYFTMGNHTFSKSEIKSLLDMDENIVIPANLEGKSVAPYAIIRTRSGKRIGLLNLLGQVYMDMSLDNPFLVADKIVEEMRKITPIIIVDFHAEATSEKKALGFYLDGRVSAVLGTHTHVQTSDARVLPNKTAYITDVGMTGPIDSVLGLSSDIAIKRFLTGEKVRYKVSVGESSFSAVVIDIDEGTGLARDIITLNI